jgi:hypothetical protein
MDDRRSRALAHFQRPTSGQYENMNSRMRPYIMAASGRPSRIMSRVVKPPAPYAIMAGADVTGMIAMHCAMSATPSTIPTIGRSGLCRETRKPMIAGVIAVRQEVILVKQKRTKSPA